MGERNTDGGTLSNEQYSIILLNEFQHAIFHGVYVVFWLIA